MSHVGLPHYKYLDTISIDDACSFIYGDSNPVTEYLEEKGSHTGGPEVICAGIAGVGGITGGGAGFVVASATCASGVLGCAIEGIISKSTPCGDVLIEVHVSENPAITSPDVLVVPACESGVLGATIDDYADTAEDYIVSGLNTVAEGVDITRPVEHGVDIANSYYESGAETTGNIASDLQSGGGRIADEGAGLISDGASAIGW